MSQRHAIYSTAAAALLRSGFTPHSTNWRFTSLQERRLLDCFIRRYATLAAVASSHFNGSYRREVLDGLLFTDLEQVREETGRWLAEYDTERPYESLGGI